jgi:RNA ligase
MQAEVFLEKPEHLDYKLFIEYCISADYTPIFEWCSNKQKIVIDHPKDRLVLTGVRHNHRGDYMPIDQIYDTIEYCRNYVEFDTGTFGGNIEVVKEVDHAEVVNHKDVEGEEGWIANIGKHKAKIKTDWYVLRHRSKDSILREKNVVSMIVNQTIDDIKPFLIEDDIKKIDEFFDLFYSGIGYVGLQILKTVQEVRAVCPDKKTFALEYADKYDAHMRSIIFKSYSVEPDYAHMLDLVTECMDSIIAKNLGSQTKIDSVRYLWNDHKWVYGDFND